MPKANTAPCPFTGKEQSEEGDSEDDGMGSALLAAASAKGRDHSAETQPDRQGEGEAKEALELEASEDRRGGYVAFYQNTYYLPGRR